MRLLLDEHLSPALARNLRQREQDAVSALEVGLEGATDAKVLDWAIRDRRAVVTADLEDFRPLHQACVERGEETFGLVLLSSSRFSPARAAFGVLIEAHDAFLAGHPGDRDLALLEYWLEPSRAAGGTRAG